MLVHGSRIVYGLCCVWLVVSLMEGRGTISLFRYLVQLFHVASVWHRNEELAVLGP